MYVKTKLSLTMEMEPPNGDYNISPTGTSLVNAEVASYIFLWNLII